MSFESVAPQPGHLFRPLLFYVLCSLSVALRFTGDSHTLIDDIPPPAVDTNELYFRKVLLLT